VSLAAAKQGFRRIPNEATAFCRRPASGRGTPSSSLHSLPTATVLAAGHAPAALGLGRAHRGVLPHVARRPGLTIAEVFDILRLFKQNLNRVLREMHRDRIGRQHQLDLRGEIPAREAALLQPKRSACRFGSRAEPAGPQASVFPLATIDRGWRGSVETTGLGGALCTGGSPQ
jgi:hypothetical protein